MIAVEQARRLIAQSLPAPLAEEIDLSAAEGRILARPFSAPFDLPRFDNAAMDGYALRAADVAQASTEAPVRLRVVGVSAARGGDPPAVGAGECAQVMTGARLPAGSDAVVMVERTSGYATDWVQIGQAAAPGQNIRRRGEELRAGSPLLPAGVALDACTRAVMAGFGCTATSVYRRPRLALLVSGDELRQPAEALAPGEIYDSTSPLLSSLARADADVVLTRTVPDDPSLLEQALREAERSADVVVLSGGVSMGRFDYVREVSQRLGFEQRFWRVAQKPGKPLLFSLAASGALLFGLPGNPVSSLICYLEYVSPALKRWQGTPPPGQLLARLVEPFPREADKQRFLLATAGLGGEGLEVCLSKRRGSHMLTAALGANCICGVPPGEGPLEPGARVAVRLLPWAQLAGGVQLAGEAGGGQR